MFKSRRRFLGFGLSLAAICVAPRVSRGSPFPGLATLSEDALPHFDIPEPGVLVDGAPRIITGVSGLRIQAERIRGGNGLTVRDCADVELVGLDIADSTFSGLTIENSRRVRVLGGHFHDNGRKQKGSPSGRLGHGIHLVGACEDIVIAGVRSDGNYEDGLQAGNDFTGVAWLVDCRMADNMENAVDQKSGTIVHVRPDYGGNGDGRGMEAIIVHNQAAECRIYEGRLAVKDDNASCLNVANDATAFVAGTALDAAGVKSFCVEAGKKAHLVLMRATLRGGDGRPMVKTKGAKVRMDGCRLHSNRTVWLRIDGDAYDKEAVLAGIDTAIANVRNCAELPD